MTEQHPQRINEVSRCAKIANLRHYKFAIIMGILKNNPLTLDYPNKTTQDIAEDINLLVKGNCVSPQDTPEKISSCVIDLWEVML